MKVSIIGGGGLVGSMTAYALQCGGVVSSICLIDANKDVAQGQALDLLHGASLAADQRITAGDYGATSPTSNVVVITAGLRRKPDESRLDLINRNVDLFLALLDQVKAAGLKENAYLVVVSNPVDVLTYLAVQRARPAVAARPRPGHAARHGPLPQLPGPPPAGAGRRRCRR